MQQNLSVFHIKKAMVNKDQILKIKSLLELSKKPLIILGGTNWSENSKKNI